MPEAPEERSTSSKAARQQSSQATKQCKAMQSNAKQCKAMQNNLSKKHLSQSNATGFPVLLTSLKLCPNSKMHKMHQSWPQHHSWSCLRIMWLFAITNEWNSVLNVKLMLVRFCNIYMGDSWCSSYFLGSQAISMCVLYTANMILFDGHKQNTTQSHQTYASWSTSHCIVGPFPKQAQG